MLHWNLLTGLFPVALLVLAAIGGIFLLARRNLRHWWTVTVPVVAVVSIGLAFAIAWYVNDIWQPFPDPLPGAVTLWIGIIAAGIGMLIATLVRTGGWQRRVIAVVAAIAIAAAGLNEINQAFGYYPTLATALGQAPAQQIPLPALQAGPGRGTASDPTDPPGGTGSGTDASAGDPPADPHGSDPQVSVPTRGAISEVTIPGTISGFHARPAWVYLPPAYLTARRPDLPVLMLLPGQPGSPSDWLNGGRLLTTMDDYAAHHHGRAPIVILPDPNGSRMANTMCLNSRLGQVDTYLSRDVVNWTLHHLQVDRDTAHWAVGGFSYGGTCALQLAVAHPTLFPTFLDISGQVAPTLGSNARTVRTAFGGDEAAYKAVQPLLVLAKYRSEPGMAIVTQRLDGTFAVGAEDNVYGPQARTVMRACDRAGVHVRMFTVPGKHSWYVAADALVKALPHLAVRMHIADLA